MNRRHWLAALMAAVSGAVIAQPRKYRLAILAIVAMENFIDGKRDAMLSALAALGYGVGQNLEIEQRIAQDPADLDRLAHELASGGFDVIVTEGTPATLAMQRATRTVPVVTSVADPLAAGFARTLQRPGGNITGLSQSRTASARKTLEILRIFRPSLKSVAFVYELPLPGADYILKSLHDAAAESGIAAHDVAIPGGSSAKALSGLHARRIDAVVAITDVDYEAAVRARIALMAGGERQVEAGALASVANDPDEDPARLAAVVDKVLRGIAPAEIPFSEASRFRVVINAKTAAALGLRITPELRLRADRVIE